MKTRSIQPGRPNSAGPVAECWWSEEDACAADELFGPAQIVLPSQAGQPVTAGG